MTYFEWHNEIVGDFDVFLVLDGVEVLELSKKFQGKDIKSANFPEENKYYYFLNTKKKTITPMPNLSLAFGGMYNGYPPYGEELKIDIDFSNYTLVYYKGINNGSNKN